MPDKSHRRLSTDRRTEILKYLCSAIIIAAAVGTYIFLSSMAKKPATKESTALIPQVSTETVTPYFGSLDLVVPGAVKAHREIRIAAEVVGKIVKKYPEFQAGNFVLAGTPLAEIDAQEYKADQKTLAADFQQSEKRIVENQRQIEGEMRNLEIAQQDLKIQQRDFKRTQRLASALSRSEVDQARRALNAAQANLTARENALGLLKATAIRLKAGLEMSRSQLEKSELNLGRVSIVAPADGVIVEEMVQENDFVSPGSAIAMFEDVSVAEVVCNLTTTELNWIRKNSKPDPNQPMSSDPRVRAYQLPRTEVTIYESEDLETTWKGTLERFDGIGRDEITKTIPCRIIVPNPIAETKYGPRALVRNMFVKCRVEVDTSSSDETQDLLAISEMALQPGNFVWKVVDEKLQLARVEVVDRTERGKDGSKMGIVIIRALEGSVSIDDEVVITPLSQPITGAVVDVTDSSKSVGDVSEVSAGMSKDGAVIESSKPSVDASRNAETSGDGPLQKKTEVSL